MIQRLLAVSAIASFLISFLGIFTFTPKLVRHADGGRGPTGAMQALNHWSTPRAYPDKDVPPDAYYRTYLTSRGRMKPVDQASPLSANIWEPIGPLNSDSRGRSISVAVNPLNSNAIYCGTASGGLWRSRKPTIGGDWQRIPLGYPALGIGAICIDPVDTTIMYVGTGEVHRYATAVTGIVIRTTRGSYGLGILKTTNAGVTWTKSLDWTYSQQRGIQQIKLNPSNRNTIFAATTEGVYRSRDAGGSWSNVNPVVMATDVVINSLDTNLVLAVCGNFKSSGFGFYRSTDAGTNWTKVSGTPLFSGKTRLEPFAANPYTVYASVADSTTNVGGFYRSVDFGLNWTLLNSAGIFGVQGWYSHFAAVHRTDSTKIVHAGLSLNKSLNGGVTFSGAAGGYSDNHNYAHDALQPNVLYGVSDNGIYRSTNFGDSWTDIGSGMQTLQFYSGFSNSSTDSLIALGQVQDHIPGYLYTGSLTWGRPSGTDEVGMTAIDQTNDNNMYAISRGGGTIYKSVNRGASFSAKVSPGGTGAWNSPIAVSESNPSVVYAAKQHVFKSTDGGNSFTTMNGGSMLDANPALCLSVAATDPNIVFVGTAPSVVAPHMWRTTNGGTSWTDVTGVLPNRYPLDISINPKNAGTIYATYGGFGSGHVFKSTNVGSTWTDISGTLPNTPTWAILVDPIDTNIVFVGNDIGVYVSSDAGASWSTYSEGLPEAVLCADLAINLSSHLLRVATHGNGVYERHIDLGSSAPNFDYRAFALITPSGGSQHILGSTLPTLSASFRNSGVLSQSDSLDVGYRILLGATEVFSDVRRIPGLGASEVRPVTFNGSFFAADTGTYTMQAINLKADQDSTNDTVRGSFAVILPPTITTASVAKIYCPYTEIIGGTAGPAGDDVQKRIVLPFAFTYNGVSYDSLQISTNGWAEFGTGTQGSLYGLSSNAQIGSIGANENGRLATIQHPLKTVGPWWDDLNTDPAGSAVTYQTLQSAPDRIFVVQWKNVRAYWDPGLTTTLVNFQLRLHETSNIIDCIYGPVIPGTFAGSDIGAMTGMKDHFGGDYHYLDFATGGTGLAADVSTDLSPLTNWPGQDSCYRIQFDATTPLISHEVGWNMVSMPVLRGSYALSSISYPSGYYYAGSYVATDSLLPGRGAWVKFPSAGNQLIVGTSMPATSIDVMNGWNMIGSVDHSVSAPGGGSISAPVYAYSTTTGYTVASSIEPGKGYWLKSNGAATITLGPTVSSKAQPSELEHATSFILTDRLGRSQSLFLVNDQRGAINANFYLMPPPMPEGNMDVRFSSQRLAEIVPDGNEHEFPLSISGAEYPIQFTVTTNSSSDLFLQVGDKRRSLQDGTVIIPGPDSRVSILITRSSLTPTEFALGQNYPNPFNPSTTIRYELPRDAKVILKVYSMLGEEITTLVNEHQSAGYKSVRFDASGLPSGMYFYQLSTGSFTAVKKFVLVK